MIDRTRLAAALCCLIGEEGNASEQSAIMLWLEDHGYAAAVLPAEKLALCYAYGLTWKQKQDMFGIGIKDPNDDDGYIPPRQAGSEDVLVIESAIEYLEGMGNSKYNTDALYIAQDLCPVASRMRLMEDIDG